MFATLITQRNLKTILGNSTFMKNFENGLKIDTIHENLDNSYTFNLSSEAGLLAEIQNVLIKIPGQRYQILYTTEKPVSFIQC